MKKIFVQIAGALNSDACGHTQNLNKMFNHELSLNRLNFTVYNPGWLFLTGLMHGNMNHSDYLQHSFAMMERMDCISLVPNNWKGSKGTAEEIKKAKRLGIPIFESVNELLNWRANLIEKEQEQEIIDMSPPNNMIEYELARDLLESLWGEYSWMLEHVARKTGYSPSDTAYMRKLRERLFDFGVRGIKGYKYMEDN